MRALSLKKDVLPAFAIFVFSLCASAYIVFAQGETIPDRETSLTYPVAELGNCKDTVACRAYCDKPENSRACLVFVKKHKLASPEEIAKWEKFIDVAAGGGPGGCHNEKECISYCEDALHIVACTDFVAKYKLVSADDLAEMRKIANAVKAGAALPGNCHGKAECVSYCEDPAHIDECLVFAEKAGLFPPAEIAEAKKVAPFIKSGETPGHCTSKAACESYCSDESHFEECVSFGEKAGFIGQKEAELVRKFKGKSPGDCAKGAHAASEARRACMEFCNNPINQPTCFRFAVEAGIMTDAEATQAGSLSDFQACLPSAPQEIQQCFIMNLGPELYDAMKQGVLPLEGDIGEMMAKIREARACVNRYADQALQTLTDDPDALKCIDSELGQDYLQKASRGEVKCGDAAPAQKKIAACMEKAVGAKIDHCASLACSEATTCIQKLQNHGRSGEGDIPIDPAFKTKLESKLNACVAEEIRACLTKNCDEMTSCINRLQAQAQGEKSDEGKADPALEQEITAKMTSCAKDQGGGSGGESVPPQYQRELPQPPSPTQPPSPDQYPQSGGQIPQEYLQQYCPNFAAAPSCSYVGSPDSQNYKYCKQCFPDK